LGHLDGTWEVFGELGFFGVGQRRGVHVGTPEIGSRGGVLCFGGIQRFYAELRREFLWGNFNLGLFEDLVGVPRGSIEEGGHLCYSFVFLGELCVN
jgi:hypothetical protein